MNKEPDPKNQVGEAIDEPHMDTPEQPLVDYASNRVVGVFAPGEAEGAVAALKASGFTEVESYCGEEGAKRIDFAGQSHGLSGKVARTLRWLTDDKDMRRYEAELLAGNCLVLAYSDFEPHNKAAGRIMEQHGGRFINHFGPMVVTELKK